MTTTEFGTWKCRQLTKGSSQGEYHQHSYYDIPVFDSQSSRIAATRMTFAGRDITADDRIIVGYVSLADDTFTSLAETSAFSLQQGPMAQWVPNTETMVWSDRENGELVARAHDCNTGKTRTYRGMIYALAPDGGWGLSLNMDRIETLRPGYGYSGGNSELADRFPSDDGVWHIDLETGDRKLIVSFNEAWRTFSKSLTFRERVWFFRKRPYFWFNHVKISPDGARFTVKFRWRVKGKSWNGQHGASLTIASDGSDIRILERATSHVIWEDPFQLYYYSVTESKLGVWRIADEPDGGKILNRIGKDVISGNVHIRKLPGSDSVFVFDTPYQPTVDLKLLDESTGEVDTLESFTGHEPSRGPYRCDLHPCPSPDGKHIVVTSLQDGGRQIYLLSRD